VDAEHAIDPRFGKISNIHQTGASHLPDAAQDDQTRDQGVSDQDLPIACQEGEHHELRGKEKAGVISKWDCLLQIQRLEKGEFYREVEGTLWWMRFDLTLTILSLSLSLSLSVSYRKGGRHI
jgi:hypothetical protein